LARKQTLLRLELFKEPVTICLVETSCLINQIIEDKYAKDPFIQEIVQLLRNNARQSKIVNLSECEERNERFYHRSRLVLLDNDELKIKILRATHNALLGGYPGRGKTLELIQREYY
jgi:hypothetical protein